MCQKVKVLTWAEFDTEYFAPGHQVNVCSGEKFDQIWLAVQSDFINTQIADSTDLTIFSFLLSVFSITVNGRIRMKKSIYLGHRLISCFHVLVNMSKNISFYIQWFSWFNKLTWLVNLTRVWILLQLEKVLSSPEIYDHRASRSEQWIWQHFETRPRLGSSA